MQLFCSLMMMQDLINMVLILNEYLSKISMYRESQTHSDAV